MSILLFYLITLSITNISSLRFSTGTIIVILPLFFRHKTRLPRRSRRVTFYLLDLHSVPITRCHYHSPKPQVVTPTTRCTRPFPFLYSRFSIRPKSRTCRNISVKPRIRSMISCGRSSKVRSPHSLHESKLEIFGQQCDQRYFYFTRSPYLPFSPLMIVIGPILYFR